MSTLLNTKSFSEMGIDAPIKANVCILFFAQNSGICPFRTKHESINLNMMERLCRCIREITKITDGFVNEA